MEGNMVAPLLVPAALQAAQALGLPDPKGLAEDAEKLAAGFVSSTVANVAGGS
jgi:hypothetical protein